jgi:hypothetical protein
MVLLDFSIAQSDDTISRERAREQRFLLRYSDESWESLLIMLIGIQ